MATILTIAFNTFREILRKRVLYVFLIFSLILIGSSRLFAFLSPEEHLKLVKDINLAVIGLFGMLIAIFSTASLIPDELERRSIFIILSKPIRRYQFLLGKFLGSLSMVAMMMLLMLVIFLLLLYIILPSLMAKPPAHLEHLEPYMEELRESFDPDILLAILLTFLGLVILTSIATFLSTFASTILNLIFCVVIYLAGNAIDLLKYSTQRAESQILKWIFKVLYTLLPNFSNFNVSDAVVEGRNIPLSYLGKSLLYCFIYTTVIMGLAIWSFNRKEI